MRYNNTSADTSFPRQRARATLLTTIPRAVPAGLSRFWGILLLSCTPMAMPLWAQAPATKAAAGTAPTPAPEPTIELSPFVVTERQDTGYLAQDTLSGTRTRTSLKDVPSAVSVFTADFLSDLGATSEEDVMRYSASAVPEVGDQSLSVDGNGISGPRFQYRIRGQAASRTRNYFNALAPPDTYNLGRFEEARGPNAILFGMGGAGGILNQTTKRAMLTQQQTAIAVSVGSDDFIRGEIDHNQVLVPSKVALRINAMAEDANGWRPHEFDRQERAHLAGTFQLLPKAKLHVDLEVGSSHFSNSRDFGTGDSVSLWLDRGRPTTAAATANAAQGIALLANNQRVTLIGNDGSARNFQQRPVSTTDAARRDASIVDPSLLPNDAFVPGPGADRFVDFHSQTAFLELQPLPDLFIEVAADRQWIKDKRYDYSGGQISLFGDPGLFYRDGAANPYAGDLYFDMNWILKGEEEKRRSYRATASYTLKLGKWGRHNFTVMAQDSREDLLRLNRVPVLLGSPFNVTQNNARNQITTRNYITDPSDVSQYAVASWRQIPAQVSVIMNPGAAPSAFDTGWVTSGGGLAENWQTIRSYLAATQSYFFQDRLVASLGFRRDERDAYTRPLLQDTVMGPSIDRSGPVQHSEVAANQSSLGLVFHATPWLSLLYNQSENAQAGGRGRLIPDGRLATLSKGQGRDAGIMLSLLEGKAFVRLTYYETSSADETKPFGAATNTADRHDRILDTMVTDGLLTPAAADRLRFTGAAGQTDLLDRETTGYELNLTANPTASWRLILSASQGKTIETNMLKQTKSVRDSLLTLWSTARQTSITDASRTVAQEIDDFNTWYAGNTAIEGEGSLGEREWQVKFFNRYGFMEGLLKGWNVGGGWRYQSAPIIGANAAAGIFYKGESTTELDLFFGYETRVSWFGRRSRLSFQVNGNNLLHRRDYLSVRRNPDGILSTIRFVDPASYKLQARLSF